MQTHPLWPPTLLGLFALASMGFFALAKIAFAAGVPPLAFTFWQAAGGALTSIAWCLARGIPIGASARHLRFYGIAGLVGVVAPNALVFAALPHVGAGPVGLVYALSPVLTYALALATGWEKPGPWRALGILLGLAGALMVLVPRGAMPEGGATAWMTLAFLAPVALALGNVYRKADWPPGAIAPALAAGTQGFAALVFLPLMLGLGQGYAPGPALDQAGLAIVALMLLAGLAQAIYFELQRVASPVYFSQISYVTTFAGLAVGVLGFGERYSPWIWAAIPVTVGGLLLVTFGGERAARG
jgi:drug/metabolite transporter (DMT)-like permease